MDGLTPARETSIRRAVTMRAGLDLARLSGLEIGPLADPIVHKSEGLVRYVDRTGTDELRLAFANNDLVDSTAIVEIDAIWGEQTLSQCIAGDTVDYIMASHVAEHVPDLITWLAEARAVLRPGGQLRLALPDARFSHDALRGETRLVDLLAAWVLGVRRPQVRDVLDFRLHTAPDIDARTIFDGTADLSQVKPQHSFAVAVQSAGWARDSPDHYFDVHCWVVQPRSFARLMQRLAGLGLLQFACAGMFDTNPPIWEFYAFLTPCDDPAAAEQSWREVYATLQNPLPGSASARQLEIERHARDAAVTHLDDVSRALVEAEDARQLAQADLAAVRSRLMALEASASWRITAPLRRLRTLLR